MARVMPRALWVARLTAGLTFMAAAVAAPAAAQTRAAPPAVVFRNELPGTYQLRHLQLWVDGTVRYDGAAPFALAVPPGVHRLAVVADYRMHDPVLPYVSGYAFELRSTQPLRLEPGEREVVRAVEAGGVTTPVERRAQILWR